jgi:hypothetical protein
MLTKQGRQEHAYRSYVRKWSLRQDRRKVKYHRTNHLFSPPSQPVTVTQAVPETPESVTTSTPQTESPTP